MLKLIRHTYLNQRFFIALSVFVGLFIWSYLFPGLWTIIRMLFLVFLGLSCVDLGLLFVKSGIKAQRSLPEKLSNGDINVIEIILSNQYHFNCELRLIDELPFQYQKRDFEITTSISSNSEKKLTYNLRPIERGEYYFGHLNVYVKSPIGLVSRRYQFAKDAMVPNYPSFLQLRKYMLLAFSNKLFDYGLKKIRRIGQTMEFEQIKDYVTGDNIRNINWRATAKRSQLMVNQFQDERSQPVYSIIDKGRAMKMPFDGLTLLDYAINATLVISNVIIKKHDKAGMFSFSKKVENRVQAERRPVQMNKIMETLYNLQTDFAEPDFSRLYVDLKRNVTQRSLLLLFTNFETLDALHRQLPFLQSIAKNHLLVVIFFENTELNSLQNKTALNTFEVFQKTIAEKFIYEKKLIVNELQRHGIQTILTEPEQLTINTINKYLEIKARGLF